MGLASEQYVERNATSPDWWHAAEVMRKRLRIHDSEIKALQNDVVTLRNELEAMREDDPTKAALIRRWEALGDE
jgi:hypothetical protein